MAISLVKGRCLFKDTRWRKRALGVCSGSGRERAQQRRNVERDKERVQRK